MALSVATADRMVTDGVPSVMLAALAGLSRELIAARDPAAAVTRALEDLRAGLEAQIAAVLLWEGNPTYFLCRSGGDAVKARRLDATIAKSLAQAVEAGVGDPARRLAVAGHLEQVLGIRCQSLIWAPLMTDDDTPVGAVIALGPPSESGFEAGKVEFLGAAADTMALAVTGERARRSLAELGETHRDLELAGAIQRSLLPEPDSKRSPVQGLNRPARIVSGDFYDYLCLPDGRFPFALGDVSGKGMNAALMMSKSASLFRCLAKTIDDPAALLVMLNREIFETSIRGMFVTMVVGVYDPVKGRVRFANAGHEPPLLRLPDRSYREFPASSPPLGILERIDPETVEVALEGGEFYVFSDGLTEFAHGEGEMLGVAGLIQLVEVSTSMPLAERLDALLADLDADGWAAHDDLTALTIDGAWVRRDE
jgi:sigma-B regulation protein RsbU (phosphoserine phosphatase)